MDIIAKVVSGRTDNAVKNRFSILCKKRAKHEALAKENNAFINLNNKRVIFPNGLNIDGVSESEAPLKKMRSDVSSTSDAQCNAGKQTEEHVRTVHLLSPPFKVNSEDTYQSLENAWQVLQYHLSQTKDGNPANLYTSSDPFNLNELVEDSSSNECSQLCLRQPDHEASSPSNSVYSTGSTRLFQPDYGRTKNRKAEHNELLLQGFEAELHSISTRDQRDDHLSPSEPVQENGILVFGDNCTEFSSPIQVTPLFRSLAAAVPTPNFSESERHFLLRALGLESTSPNPSSNSSKPSQCKRVLLHSL